MDIDAKQSPDAQKKPVDNGLTGWQALGFAWQMGYTMAIPLVLLALGGRLLDRYLQTSPLFLLIGIILSIGVSSYALAVKAVKLIKDSENTNK